MEKIYYNKLCRDKVPEIIKEKGFECEVREVDHAEYKREIIKKVLEEATGVFNHKNDERLLKELADLIITIESVKKEYDISEDALQAAVTKSIEEKGGYDKRLYLSWSSDTDYSSHDHGGGIDD